MIEKIRPLADRKGVASPFGLSYYVQGKRRRLYFGSATERNDKIKELRRRAVEVGEEGMAVSREDLLLLERVREIIGENVSLVEVARFWSNAHRSVEQMDFETAIDLFANYRKKKRVSVARIRNGDTVLQALGAAVGGSVGDITEKTLSGWLFSLPHEPSTIKSYRDHCKVFFEYCARMGWANPLDFGLIEKIKVGQKTIEYMAVDDVAAMMKFTWANHPHLCGILALGFFGGLRTSSIERLRFSDINFEDQGIELPAEEHKLSQRFYVDSFPAVLWLWLEAVRDRVGPVAFEVTPKEWDKWRPVLCTAVGTRWPHNCMRKTFTTHLVAATGNEAEVATTLTHSNVRQLKQNYKGRTTRANGKRYLTIKPSNHWKK